MALVAVNDLELFVVSCLEVLVVDLADTGSWRIERDELGVDSMADDALKEKEEEDDEEAAQTGRGGAEGLVSSPSSVSIADDAWKEALD